MVAANLAERKDTFVLYVPNVTSWLNGGHPFALNAVTGLYDQPEATQELLNFLQHFHQSSVLNDMKLGTKHRLPDGTTLDAGTSFANLLQSGIKSKGNATAAFAALLDELAACRSHRVVVALDMVNGLYADTAYHDTESQRLNATQFTLMRELATFAEGKRSLVGLCVC